MQLKPGPAERVLCALCASVVVFSLFFLGSAGEAQTPADMLHTKHNLSVSGPGPIRALTETRICIFCHTPHNATPLSPLWNKALEPQVYTVYASPTLKAGPLPQPSGPTKLCLSCHDGTIAMGAVVNPAGGISMASGAVFPPGSLSEFGLDLSGHHPVSFAYSESLPNAELAGSPPADLVYGGTDEIHCITCHDPHNDAYGKFLLKDNRYSALCIRCHQITGWSASAHATSAVSVVGVLPRPPKTWPTYTQMNEWGCEVCHTPHSAPTAEELLNFTALPPDPFSCTSAGCHSSQPPPAHGMTAALQVGAMGGGRVGMVDVGRQILKVSAHHQPLGLTAMTPSRLGGAARSGIRSVICVDCHNPHLANNDVTAAAPYASGLVRGVSGVDRNAAELREVTYEYEICFKCHADNTPDVAYVTRVLTVTNTRLAFDPSNPSYHPVLAMGKNLNIPSIPSSLAPTMNAAEVIYCTTCHADDQGASKGPHGSSFAPILKERYETANDTPENYDNYALCYRCHERSSILRDESFRRRAMGRGGHSGHLQAGAPCSACHDPHGVDPAGAPMGTGDHTHLINFDTRIVCATPTSCGSPGPPYPAFKDRGTFSGSCNLFCHSVLHDDAACSAPAPGKVCGAYP